MVPPDPLRHPRRGRAHANPTSGFGDRPEPGVERFVIYQSEADPRRFLLNEHWHSKAAWEAHRDRRVYKEIYAPQILPLVTREPHISSLVE